MFRVFTMSARKSSPSASAGATPAYGISTGFGALATRHIPTDMRAQLQKSLVRSHAAGSGPEVEREVVRGLMLLRLSTLTTGRTGVRPELAELIASFLNAGITPVVSFGASFATASARRFCPMCWRACSGSASAWRAGRRATSC